MKFLLVDDSHVMRFMLEKYIAAVVKSSVFVHAKDGLEGLHLLTEQNDFDVIFLDVTMPNMDGEALLEQIRANPTYDSIYIIMATAVGEEKRVRKLIELGANNYLVKPFQQKAVYKALQGVMSAR